VCESTLFGHTDAGAKAQGQEQARSGHEQTKSKVWLDLKMEMIQNAVERQTALKGMQGLRVKFGF